MSPLIRILVCALLTRVTQAHEGGLFAVDLAVEPPSFHFHNIATSTTPHMDPTTSAIAVPLEITIPRVLRLIDGIECARLLEVGCGEVPYLGMAIASHGHNVVGVDPSLSEDFIKSNTNANLAAHKASIIEFEAKPASFDGILFTKSLHHIPQLDEALTKVVGLLKPGGFIFIEEFAHELIDEPTATFVYGILELLNAAGYPRTGKPHHGHGHGHGHGQEHHTGAHAHHQSPASENSKAAPDTPETKAISAVERFSKHSAHLHTGEAMRAAIARQSSLSIVEDEKMPWIYLFYSFDLLDQYPKGLAMLRQILATEKRFAELKMIKEIGFNLVLRKQ